MVPSHDHQRAPVAGQPLATMPSSLPYPNSSALPVTSDTSNAKAKAPSGPPPPKAGFAKAMCRPPPPSSKAATLLAKACLAKAGLPELQRPPPHLAAPANAPLLRVYGPLPKANGSLWDGLSRWGAEHSASSVKDANKTHLFAEPLDGLVINYDLLREHWHGTPSTVPAAPTAPTRQQGVVDDSIVFLVEVTMRAHQLSPALLRRALTEDFDALSSEQAQALALSVAPFVPVTEGDLRMEVARRGKGALRPAEAVLWAVANVHHGMQRSMLLGLRAKLPEEEEHMRSRVDRMEEFAESLVRSRPLRTVLQLLLILRNVMSQQSHEAFSMESLAGLNNERVPSLSAEHRDSNTMKLLVNMMDATHANRRQRRILRLFAVGRLAPTNTTRKIVWQFLEEKPESPWDVLPLLQACETKLADGEVVSLIRQHRLELSTLLLHRVVEVRQGALDTRASGLWLQQLRDLEAQIVVGVEFAAGLAVRAEEALERLAVLLSAKQTQRYPRIALNCEPTAAALRGLRVFGAALEAERARRGAEKARAAAKAGRVHSHSSHVRAWTEVDTRGVALLHTCDLDLMRLLTGTPTGTAAHAPRAPVGAKAVNSPKANAEVQLSPHSPHSHLLHSGLDGVYIRCPLTGQWLAGNRRPTV